MNRRSGFTLIELLVTMTIMVILMTLAVVNIRGTQVRGRDTDRRNDVESIARQLDSLYTRGFSFTYGGSTVEFKGKYPTTVELLDATAQAGIFEDISPASLIDPAKQTASQSIFAAINGKEGTDLVNTSNTVAPSPGANYPYIYQPLDDNGNLCINDTGATPQNCRRFNIYWYGEYDNTIHVVKSRYQ